MSDAGRPFELRPPAIRSQTAEPTLMLILFTPSGLTTIREGSMNDSRWRFVGGDAPRSTSPARRKPRHADRPVGSSRRPRSSFWSSLLCASLAGCGSQSKPDPVVTPSRDFSDVAIDRVIPVDQGVSVEQWITAASLPGLLRSLGPLAREELADRRGVTWSSNGLRVYRARVEDVGRVRAAAPLENQVRRDDLAMIPRWTPIARGRVWSSPLDLWLDQEDWSSPTPSGAASGERSPLVSAGRLTLESGRLRLLARTWLSVAPHDSPEMISGRSPLRPRMVLQLLPQHTPGASDRGDGTSFRLDAPEITRHEREGQVFERLLLEITLDPGEILLIIPVHPRERAGEDAVAAREAPTRSDRGTETPTVGSVAAAPNPAAPVPRPNPSALVPAAKPTAEAPARQKPKTETDPIVGPQITTPTTRVDQFRRAHAAPSTLEPGTATDAPSNASEPISPVVVSVGPAIPDAMTIGEAMLTDAMVGGGARRRALLLIIPRLGDSYAPPSDARETAASERLDTDPATSGVSTPRRP